LGSLCHARTRAAVLAEIHINAAKLYMKQVAALREVDDVFSAGTIRHAVIKGAATREGSATSRSTTRRDACMPDPSRPVLVGLGRRDTRLQAPHGSLTTPVAGCGARAMTESDSPVPSVRPRRSRR